MGGDALTQEQAEAQLAAQSLATNSVIRNSTANRRLGNFNPVSNSGSSRLAFLSGPAGSVRYVRSTNAMGASGRSLAGAVNGVRSLSGNIETGNSRAASSAATLRQSAGNSRTLAGSFVSSQKGRGLAVLSQARTQSASLTRNLVSRSIASKSARVSAEWIAKVLRDRRGTNNSGGGNDVPTGSGPRSTKPTNTDKSEQIAEEIRKANERRRETMLAQADSMIKAIQNAVSRSGEIVKEIQAKILARDIAFNKTVQDMVKKPPKSQYTMVKGLINGDALRMQELATLKAEYDALSSSIPMLTSSLNRLGGLNPQISSNLNSGINSSLTLPTGGTDGRFSGSSGTSVFADPNSSGVAQPRVQGVGSEFALKPNLIDSLTIKLLPEAWAQNAKPGTLAYEQRWAQAFETFSSDWDLYLNKLHDVEKSDRTALVKRYRELTQAPGKLALNEPDAATFSLMWETMDVISEESKYLMQARKDDARGNLSRVKVYQDVEAAQVDAEKTIDFLAEWGQNYVKSAPESYYDDPQAWEVILPNAILY